MKRRGFTLIEILVSVSIMMLLIGAAFTAFLELRSMTRRIQARQALCDTSRLVYARLRSECDAMVHVGAWWLRSTPTTTTLPTRPDGNVELIFLRGKTDTRDHHVGMSQQPALTDLVWTRIFWDASTSELRLSASSSKRTIRLTQDWTSPSGRNYRSAYAAFLPVPVRQAGTDPAAVLELNRIGNGDPADVGDYTDLVRNGTPIILGCTDFAIQAVLVDGTTVDATTGASTSLAGDGLPISGRDVLIQNAVTNAWQRRPRLLRMRFTIRAPESRKDPATGLDDPKELIQQTFSYTFRTSQLLPP